MSSANVDSLPRLVGAINFKDMKKNATTPSGKQEDDHASTSCAAPKSDWVGKAIDEWNRGSRSMGIGSQLNDSPSRPNPRNESPSESRGVWLGQQVLETWDCGLDGMKLVLENGKEVSLTSREFYAWGANSCANVKGDPRPSEDQASLPPETPDTLLNSDGGKSSGPPSC